MYDSWDTARLRKSLRIEAVYALPFVSPNFGIAIAARSPMITTTISNSIRVKPAVRLWKIMRNHAFCGIGGTTALREGNAGAVWRLLRKLLCQLLLYRHGPRLYRRSHALKCDVRRIMRERT